MRVEQSHGGSLSRLCSLSGYSRQAYYKRRIRQEDVPLKEELIIQQVLDIRRFQPRIGGRKLFFMLGTFLKQHQFEMGRDTFFRMLGGYGLLNKRLKYRPRTTESGHRMKKHPDLIRELVPARSDELWVSDITYLNLSEGHVYLSLVTDAYSRKIVGFHVSSTLRAEGCLKALHMAISGRKKIEGLIHHSDRGLQYCCDQYVGMLKDCKIDISMTRSGNPRDNAIAERVNGILKMELLEAVFANLEEASDAVTRAVNIYNYLRPHSSLSMLTPALVHGRKLKLNRCWKNYYKKKRPAEGVVAD
jgi:transposase InsO family protein